MTAGAGNILFNPNQSPAAAILYGLSASDGVTPIPILVGSDGSLVIGAEPPSTASTVAITPVVTAALATSKVIKASAGNLYGLNLMATTVAGIFLVHNSATAPAAGAVTPLLAFPVGIGQAIAVDFNPPLRFGTGISVTFTSAATPFTQTDSATAFISGDAV